MLKESLKNLVLLDNDNVVENSYALLNYKRHALTF